MERMDERRSERFMRAVVEQLHGVTLTQYDRDGLQGAVDYVFDAGNGGGAVEVTTVRDGRAAAWFDALDRESHLSVDSARAWTLTIELGATLKELKRRLPAVVEACDRHSVDFPLHVPAEEWGDDVLWIVSTNNHLRVSEYGEPGSVRLQMPAITAVISPDASGLDRELGELLTGGRFRGKFEKLQRHPDVVERHLAVGVDFYGSGFELIDHLLLNRGNTPSYDPPADFPVTHLWINGGGYAVLTWNRRDGWSWQVLKSSSRDRTQTAGIQQVDADG